MFLPAAGLCVWQLGLREAVEAVRKRHVYLDDCLSRKEIEN